MTTHVTANDSSRRIVQTEPSEADREVESQSLKDEISHKAGRSEEDLHHPGRTKHAGLVSKAAGTGTQSAFQAASAAFHLPERGVGSTVPRAAGPAGSSGTSADRIFDQVVDRVKLAKIEGGQFRLNLTLKPDFLGRIQIETVYDSDHSLKAVFRVEDPGIRNLLESNLSQMVEKLNQSGINVEKAEVADFSENKEGGASGQEAPDSRPRDESGRRASSESAGADRLQDESGAEEMPSTGQQDDGTLSYFA